MDRDVTGGSRGSYKEVKTYAKYAEFENLGKGRFRNFASNWALESLISEIISC